LYPDVVGTRYGGWHSSEATATGTGKQTPPDSTEAGTALGVEKKKPEVRKGKKKEHQSTIGAFTSRRIIRIVRTDGMTRRGTQLQREKSR